MKIMLIPKVIVEISIGCNMKEEETNNQLHFPKRK